jgi:hypothetical protein
MTSRPACVRGSMRPSCGERGAYGSGHRFSSLRTSSIRQGRSRRYQVKDVARAAASYTERLGFTLEHEHVPRVRQCLARGRADSSQRSGCVGLAPPAKRRTAGAGRLEPRGTHGQRSSAVHRRTAEGGSALPKSYGNRARWPADPNRGSGRQFHRAVRAGSLIWGVERMIRKLKSGEYRLYSRKKDPKTCPHFPPEGGRNCASSTATLRRICMNVFVTVP